MTGEVISLLSSSSPEPANPRPQPAVHAAKPCSPPPKHSSGPLDLTSSSPISAPKRDRPQTSQQLPPSKHQNSTAPLDLHFLSDDFDTTGDLEHSSQIRQDAGNTKRLRLSPPEASKRFFQRSQSAAAGTETASARQGAGLRRTQTLADPIECSSSPGLGKRLRGSGQTVYDDPFATSSPVRKVEAVTRAVETILDVDDPFSTSPRRPETSTVAAKLVVDLDDPFASSPPPPQAPTTSALTGLVATASSSKLTFKPPPTVSNLDDDMGDPFASSQPDSVPLRATTSTAAALNSRPRSPKAKVNWDPISSSAPQLLHESIDSSPPPARTKGNKREPAVIDLSDSELSVLESHKWSDSDGDLPEVKDMDLSKSRVPRSKSASLPRVSSATLKASRPKAPPTAKKPTENKAREKEAKAAEREREKERKQREKDAAKEQKARDKETAAAMAEVNKVRTDKKVSTPEMIVDLPASLPPPQVLQIQTLLKDLDVEFSEWQSPVEKVVKWRRKVRSRFNDDLGLWEPMPLSIKDEVYTMVVITADEFVTLALGAEDADLEAHVSKTKQHFTGTQLIYLIEGLGPWIRKNRNLRNRQFVSAVLSQDTEAAPTSSQPNRRRKTPAPKEYIDEDTVEDALLQLQVLHGALIHHTAAAVETAQWIAIFTQHISTVPYRKQREAANAAGAGFCMESGQVRTGDDTRDTYARMLQEIVRVTAPIAYGIAEEFGTVTGLVNGLEERGPLALEACRKSANKDGAVSDRTIGQAVSRRIHKVFTGTDETSMDV
ncbi:hypothetical protein ACHAQH_007512 [Verticillium albo-atrum]